MFNVVKNPLLKLDRTAAIIRVVFTIINTTITCYLQFWILAHTGYADNSPPFLKIILKITFEIAGMW